MCLVLPDDRPMNMEESLRPQLGAHTGAWESSEQSREWTLTQGPDCPGVSAMLGLGSGKLLH